MAASHSHHTLSCEQQLQGPSALGSLLFPPWGLRFGHRLLSASIGAPAPALLARAGAPPPAASQPASQPASQGRVPSPRQPAGTGICHLGRYTRSCARQPPATPPSARCTRGPTARPLSTPARATDHPGSEPSALLAAGCSGRGARQGRPRLPRSLAWRPRRRLQPRDDRLHLRLAVQVVLGRHRRNVHVGGRHLRARAAGGGGGRGRCSAELRPVWRCAVKLARAPPQRAQGLAAPWQRGTTQPGTRTRTRTRTRTCARRHKAAPAQPQRKPCRRPPSPP
jgi:hypothetical protein